ncbi:porin [Pseudomonas sp. A46]|nr:OprD family porin [Pseudomonas sp. A46]OWJ92369.1 porin [Pseudomonas sp. A46]
MTAFPSRPLTRRLAPGLLPLAALLPLAGNGWASEGGFIDDASLNLGLRNLYFNRDFRQGGAAQSRQEEWGQGFLLQARSGYTGGAVGLGVDLLGQLGLKLDSSPDRAGSGVLPRHDDRRAADDWSRLGAALKFRVSASELKVGELMPELPVLLRNDGRLLPQTFQGAMLGVREWQGLTLQGGQMRSVSQRNSSDMEDLSLEGRGGVFSDRFNYAGAEYRFNEGRSQVGLWQAQLQDIYRQSHLGFSHQASLAGWALNGSLLYFDGREDGNQRLGDLDNRAFSAFAMARRSGHGLGLGYQRMYGDDGMLQVAGTSTPLANDVQVRNFASPEERSWQLRYDYDFSALGLPGLTLMGRYLHGDHAATATGREGRTWERDLDLAYVVQSGPLKNLGLRWRNATLRSNHLADVDENRLILSYSLALD